MLNTSESYRQAMDKLQALVNKGTVGAKNVIEHVMANQPTDRIVKGGVIDFQPNPKAHGIIATLPVFNGENLTETSPQIKEYDRKNWELLQNLEC